MSKKWFGSLLLVLFLLSCASDSDADPDPGSGGDNGNGGNSAQFDRGAMLAHWSDRIIIPAYQGFLAQHEILKTAFSDFSGAPDAQKLTALRAQWRETYKSWQRIAMFEVGPAETLGLRLNLNTYPTDPVLIENHVAGGSYDLDLPSNRDAKGFPALDYLFNGMAESDEALLAAFASEAGYTQYTNALLEDIDQRVTEVLAGWEGGFRDTFVANDGASATASVDRYVNDFIFYYEKFLRAGKMGIPLGVFTGTPAPNTLESYYDPEFSNALFLEGLDAVQGFFNGTPYGGGSAGPSLASYLKALNSLKEGDALDQRINDQLDAARALVGGLAPFRTEIEENSPPTSMLLAYDEVQAAVPLFKVDMVSAMSIAIDFVDADGD